MKTLHLIIKGRENRGKFTVAGKKYRQWEADAINQLQEYSGLKIPKCEIQMEFYMPDNIRTDTDNKVTSIFDVLSHKFLQVIADDCWQVIYYHSARVVEIDRENPRVELWLKIPNGGTYAKNKKAS